MQICKKIYKILTHCVLIIQNNVPGPVSLMSIFKLLHMLIPYADCRMWRVWLSLSNYYHDPNLHLSLLVCSINLSRGVFAIHILYLNILFNPESLSQQEDSN